ncbi:hypothetical protein [Stenotrophomonas maltophilia]|uniref:hypothetical protein n=1 Tax=Stenotrophomonas maltophilia TaxID=40324 RepID=UPI000A2F9147|nr:hypothetical protein [Stenotrophomonas maltophilia]ARQ90243.1 hypothetical protein A7326_11790 [Stenotrophomonas maltophilia]
MDMKLQIVAILMAAFAPFAYAQGTTASPQQPRIAQDDQEMSAWMRETVDRHLAENKQRGTIPLSNEELLEIVSLKDYSAPAEVKKKIANGIQSRSLGPLEVAEGTIPSASTLASSTHTRIRSDAELKEKLSYAPADLSRSPVGPAELLSIEPTGAISNGKSTGLIRTYRIPGSGILVLSEDDYVASQTRITLIRETLNSSVNGTPARTYSARSKDGKGKVELRWVTPQRSYWLTFITDDPTKIEFGEKLLKQVAQSITI